MSVESNIFFDVIFDIFGGVGTSSSIGVELGGPGPIPQKFGGTCSLSGREHGRKKGGVEDRNVHTGVPE